MKARLALVVIVLGLGAADAGAQFGGRLPSGSYSRTCSDERMIGSVLTAECKDQNGVTIRTRLFVRGCVGDIANVYGELVCERQRLPEGSFNRTCSGCTAQGSSLRCLCRDTKGASIKTALDLSSCDWSGGITNKDGHLQCD
jgi:hypothetical protein